MYIVELDSHAVRGLSLHKIALLPSTKRSSVSLAWYGWLIIPDERRASAVLDGFKRSRGYEGLRAISLSASQMEKSADRS